MFEFKHYNKQPIDKKMTHKIFQKMSRKLRNITRPLDTINIDKYNYIKKKTRFYEKTLEFEIKKKTGLKHISRPFPKLFEILSNVNLFDNVNGDVINSFHFCEAPGMFIITLEYYLNNILNKKLNWKAQTL